MLFDQVYCLVLRDGRLNSSLPFIYWSFLYLFAHDYNNCNSVSKVHWPHILSIDRTLLGMINVMKIIVHMHIYSLKNVVRTKMLSTYVWFHFSYKSNEKFVWLSAVQFMLVSMPFTEYFLADHPFVYAIKEKSSVVFMGRQVNASKWRNSEIDIICW